MEGALPQLALVVLLVLVNAAFAGSEMALVSLREGQLRRLAERGGSGAVLARLAHDPNRFLATIQVAITLAGFLASATAAVALAEPLETRLGVLGRGARATSIFLVTIALSYVTLVIGELAPKRVAMQRAESWGLAVARPLAALAAAARPVVWLLSKSTDFAVRLTGSDPRVRQAHIGADELRHLLAGQSALSAKQREILSGTFEIADRTLTQVLRHRKFVSSVEAGLPASEALGHLLSAGHSRAPVTAGGDLDQTVGIVHLRSLVGATGVAGDHATPALFLPESARVLDVLQRMQHDGERMAMVVNEHGGVEGIVTIEDLLEEIVGELYDETDPEVLAVRRGAGGELFVPGSFPLHDLIDIGVELGDEAAPGDVVSVAGLLLARLGRVPEGAGESVTVGPWVLGVEEVERRAITRVRIHPLQPRSGSWFSAVRLTIRSQNEVLAGARTRWGRG